MATVKLPAVGKRSVKAITKSMNQAQLTEFVSSLPEGLDTVIGEGGQAMSTGEKQLLAIARILCRNPSLLVLDEASSAIDSKTEKLLEQPTENCPWQTAFPSTTAGSLSSQAC